MGLLGKIIKGVVAGALVGLTAGLASPLIGTTVFAGIGSSLGLVGGTAFLSAIGGAVVGGLTGIAKGLKKKPAASATSQDIARPLTVFTDSNAGRQILYGQRAVAGQLLFKGYSGTNNDVLHMVVAVAGTEIDSLVSCKINGQTITLPASYPYGTIVSGNFSGKLEIWFHDGRDTTTPFSGADIHSLSAWNAKTRQLHGIAAVYIKATVDDAFDGRLEPYFVLKGRKLYDWRLDSTNGGSGSHRLNDESTWEWSDNPVLAMHDYCYGISTNSIRVAGMGLSSTLFDYSELTTEADICEESVALNGGGSESRYEINGFIDPQHTHRRNLDTLASAMAGRWTFANNKMRILAGSYKSQSITLSANMINGVPQSFRRYKGKDDRINTVRGVFPYAGSDYTVQAYPTMQDSAAVTADGEILRAELNLPMTTSYTMAQRIAKIFLGRSRAQKYMVANYNHKAINAVPGETASVSYGLFGLSSEPMNIVEWHLTSQEDERGNTGIGVTLHLEEEDSDWYSWDESTEEQSLTAPTALTRTAQTYALASLSGNLDDVADGSTYKRVSGVNGSNKITSSSVAAKAVTDIQAAYNSSSVSLTDWTTTGYATLESKSITTEGDQVLLLSSFRVNASSPIGMRFRLYRDSTVVLDDIRLDHAGNGDQYVAVQFVDSPSAGTYSYSIRGGTNGATSGEYAINIGITAIEFKAQ